MIPADPSIPDPPVEGFPLRLVRWLILILFGWALVRTAWVGDDAYITLRTVENFVQGHGLRWNATERVQTYSHPLWMFLILLGRLISGEYFLTILVISALCSLGAVWLAGFRVAHSVVGGLCALAVLVFCKAFVEYSTSGLESPLTHLLLGAYAVLLFRDIAPGRRLFWIACVTGLAATNRMDTVLLFLPGLLWCCLSVPFWRSLRLMALGLAPFLAWLAFATFYYGTPLPITAYAKAMTGIDSMDLVAQGLVFYRDTLTRDPVLLPALLLGFGLALWSRSPRRMVLALGGLLYCAYVLKIGGGFMAGRFLTPPLFLAAICIAQTPFRRGRLWPWASVLVGTAVLGFLCPTTPILSGDTFEGPTVDEETGIADERAVYYGRAGLLSSTTKIPPYRYDTIDEVAGIVFDVEHPEVVVHYAVGYVGFMVGPGAHLVDPWLTDPLMMRLPTRDLKEWRIGHFERRIPEGYLESLASGENLLNDPGLARVHGDLQRILRGDLLSLERFGAMWRMWTGAWKADRAAYAQGEYQTPPRKKVGLERLSERVSEGTKWWQRDLPLILDGGLEIPLEKVHHSNTMQVGLDCGDVYGFQFYLGEEQVGSVQKRTKGGVLMGIGDYSIDVPQEAANAGYDRIHINMIYRPTEGAYIGYLILP